MSRSLIDTWREWRIAHQARRFLVRMQGGEATLAERDRLQAWLGRDPRHATRYRELEQLWSSLGAVPEPALAPRARRGRVWRPGPVSLAAIAASAVGVAAFVLLLATDIPQLEPLRREVGVGAQVYQTGIGEVSRVRLADASNLTIGARSAIRFHDGRSQRWVELTDGEAFFDVVRDASRPFVVDTPHARIVVVGTRFNVHADPDGVRVVVEEGRVRVLPERRAGLLVRRGAEVVLDAGERVDVASSGAVSAVAAADVALARAWQQGRLAFDDERLATVIADLNRYSLRQITLGDERLGALRVTGLFTTGDFEALLGALESTLPVRAIVMSQSEVRLEPVATQP